MCKKNDKRAQHVMKKFKAHCRSFSSYKPTRRRTQPTRVQYQADPTPRRETWEATVRASAPYRIHRRHAPARVDATAAYEDAALGRLSCRGG